MLKTLCVISYDYRKHRISFKEKVLYQWTCLQDLQNKLFSTG